MQLAIADVKNLLGFLGWTYTDADEGFINYLMGKVTNLFCDPLHVNTIPDGVYQLAVDKVVGEFLRSKHATGKLGTMSFEDVAKRLTEGDVTIEYELGGSTPEQRFIKLLDDMCTIPKWVWSKEGRIKW